MGALGDVFLFHSSCRQDSSIAAGNLQHTNRSCLAKNLALQVEFYTSCYALQCSETRLAGQLLVRVSTLPVCIVSHLMPQRVHCVAAAAAEELWES